MKWGERVFECENCAEERRKAKDAKACLMHLKAERDQFDRERKRLKEKLAEARDALESQRAIRACTEVALSKQA